MSPVRLSAGAPWDTLGRMSWSVRRVMRGAPILGAAVLLTALPARAGLDQAVACLKAGKYLEAASELQAIVDRVPGYDYSHYLLGHCHLKTGNAVEAERSFARALALNARRPEYYVGLASAYREQRQYGRVLEIVARGEPLARDPEWRFAFLSIRAAAEVSLHRWTDAAADMERALELRRDPRVLRDLGRVYLALGRNEKAVSAFAECLAAIPGDAETYPFLLEAMLRVAADAREPARKRSLYDKVLRVAEGYDARRPGDIVAANLLGRAALGAGQYERAEAEFRKVLAADPTQCYARANLAGIFIARARWDEAERNLLDAARCGPHIGETFVRLGYVYLRQARVYEAEEAFRRASEVLPSGVAQEMLAEATRTTSVPTSSRPRPRPVLRERRRAAGVEGRAREVRVIERESKSD